MPSLASRDRGVIEVEAVELPDRVADLKVAEERLEVLEPPGPLVGEVEERFAPQLDAIDHGAQRDVGAAQQFVGPGHDLDGELLVGAGVLDRPGGDVEESDDRRSWVTGSVFGGARWSKAASWSGP